MNYTTPVANIIRQYAEFLEHAPQILRQGFTWNADRQVWLPADLVRDNPHLLQIESRFTTQRRASDSKGRQATVEETQIVLAYLIATDTEDELDQHEVEAMKQVRTLLNRIQKNSLNGKSINKPSDTIALTVPAFTSQPYYNSAGQMEAGVVFTITFQRADPFASCI